MGYIKENLDFCMVCVIGKFEKLVSQLLISCEIGCKVLKSVLRLFVGVLQLRRQDLKKAF